MVKHRAPLGLLNGSSLWKVEILAVQRLIKGLLLLKDPATHGGKTSW